MLYSSACGQESPQIRASRHDLAGRFVSDGATFVICPLVQVATIGADARRVYLGA